MPLFGTIVLDRRIVDDEVWLCEPFSRGQAWLDLQLLANDEARTLKVRGVDVRVERGQVGRSVLNLADRWQWSRDKTRRFLEELRDRRKISYQMNNVATVITVLDYTVLNSKPDLETEADQTADQTAETTPNPDAEPIQKGGTGESGKGNSGKREGDAPFDEAEIPAVDEVKIWAERSGVDPEYAERKWNDTTEKRAWLYGGRLLDWRRRWLRFWAEDKTDWLQKKIAARPGMAVDGEPPKPICPGKLTLEQMRKAIQ